MESVELKVNGRKVEAEKGLSLIEVIDEVDMQLSGKRSIPRLCYHEGLSAGGGCRLCLVEVKAKGKDKIKTSCNIEVASGLEIVTYNEAIKEKRQNSMQLLMSKAPNSEVIKDLAYRLGVKDAGKYATKNPCAKENCVNCGLCKRACKELVGVDAIETVKVEKGKMPCGGDTCIGCGICSYICPTGAIEMEEFDDKRVIWNMEFDVKELGKYKLTDEQIDFRKSLSDKIESPYTVDIKGDLCKSCERCVAECPQSLFSVGDVFNKKGYKKAKWDEFKIEDQDETLACTGCKACYDICPESAIDIYVPKKKVRLLE